MSYFEDVVIEKAIALHADPNRIPPWKYLPMTEKQRNILCEIIPEKQLVLIDRGAARILIGEVFANNIEASAYTFPDSRDDFGEDFLD